MAETVETEQECLRGQPRAHCVQSQVARLSTVFQGCWDCSLQLNIRSLWGMVGEEASRVPLCRILNSTEENNLGVVLVTRKA